MGAPRLREGWLVPGQRTELEAELGPRLLAHGLQPLTEKPRKVGAPPNQVPTLRQSPGRSAPGLARTQRLREHPALTPVQPQALPLWTAAPTTCREPPGAGTPFITVKGSSRSDLQASNLLASRMRDPEIITDWFCEAF